jgi:hypothetical protein
MQPSAAGGALGYGNKRFAYRSVPVTAILHQIAQQFAHPLIVGGIYDGAAFTPRMNKSSIRKNSQTCRQRVRKNIEFSCNLTCGNTFITRPNKKSKNREPTFMRQRRKGFNRARDLRRRHQQHAFVFALGAQQLCVTGSMAGTSSSP